MNLNNYVNLCFNNQVRCNYNFTGSFLRMTFPNAWDLSEDEVEVPVEHPDVEQTGSPIGGPTGGPIGGPIGGIIGGTIGGIIGGTIDITERQKEIIEIIAEDNKVSVTKLSNQLKINRSAAQEHIEVLKKKGLLTRIGGTRGYWQVVGLNKEGVK